MRPMRSFDTRAMAGRTRCAAVSIAARPFQDIFSLTETLILSHPEALPQSRLNSKSGKAEYRCGHCDMLPVKWYSLAALRSHQFYRSVLPFAFQRIDLFAHGKTYQTRCSPRRLNSFYHEYIEWCTYFFSACVVIDSSNLCKDNLERSPDQDDTFDTHCTLAQKINAAGLVHPDHLHPQEAGKGCRYLLVESRSGALRPIPCLIRTRLSTRIPSSATKERDELVIVMRAQRGR